MIEIVCASHNREILKNNLLKSDITQSYPVNIVYDYTNIPKAYNSIKTEGVTLYCHHDVFFYHLFEKELLAALRSAPKDWAVLGLAGVIFEDYVRKPIGYIKDRGKSWGAPIKGFVEVDTLDELMVVTRDNMRFDERFEQDFYVADICMQARKEWGRKCYVFKGFCDHNSSRVVGGRTESFYRSRKLFAEKWKDYLPIATTCNLVTEEMITQ